MRTCERHGIYTCSACPPAPVKDDEELDDIIIELSSIWADNLVLPFEERTPNPSRRARERLLAWRDEAARVARIDELKMLGNSNGFENWGYYFRKRLTQLKDGAKDE